MEPEFEKKLIPLGTLIFCNSAIGVLAFTGYGRSVILPLPDDLAFFKFRLGLLGSNGDWMLCVEPGVMTLCWRVPELWARLDPTVFIIYYPSKAGTDE